MLELPEVDALVHRVDVGPLVRGPHIRTAMPGNVSASIGTSGIDPPEPVSRTSTPYAASERLPGGEQRGRRRVDHVTLPRVERLRPSIDTSTPHGAASRRNAMQQRRSRPPRRRRAPDAGSPARAPPARPGSTSRGSRGRRCPARRRPDLPRRDRRSSPSRSSAALRPCPPRPGGPPPDSRRRPSVNRRSPGIATLPSSSCSCAMMRASAVMASGMGPPNEPLCCA